jgi:Icc protein
MKILHLTDIHLVPSGQLLFGLDPAQRLRSCIACINKAHADADLCVVTGDIADRGETEAYRLLDDILADLNVPVRLLLGNHDRRASFRAAFPDQPVDDNGFVQSVVDREEGRLILLDTLEEGQPFGRLCGARLRWLAAQLDGAWARPVYIFLHHPLDTLGMRHFQGMVLANAVDLLRQLEAHGDVRHIFCGHVHVAASGTWNGMPFSTGRGTCHHIVPDLKRRDAAFMAGAPAFDVVRVDAGSCCIHRLEAGAHSEVIAISPGMPALEALS